MSHIHCRHVWSVFYAFWKYACALTPCFQKFHCKRNILHYWGRQANVMVKLLQQLHSIIINLLSCHAFQACKVLFYNNSGTWPSFMLVMVTTSGKLPYHTPTCMHIFFHVMFLFVHFKYTVRVLSSNRTHCT